jgi:serine/threonine protein kinase/tetratricopeptide (TPR) repeat protein
MNLDRPTTYDQLSPQAAAQIDAICDRFESAWRAARSEADAPQCATFLDGCAEPERTILAAELIALDRACRHRYGTTLDVAGVPAVVGDAASTAETRSGRAGASQPRHGAEQWPRLPGLELVEVLGSGGMGVVFKARQPTLGRDVAVKLLRDAHLADAAQRERFVQEARAIAQLQHTHLVHLYEFGDLPGDSGATSRPYLVLEYVAGGSLANLLRHTRLAPLEAAQLVESLAEAIHYAHQQGIIHRDLKPGNILLASVVRGPSSVVKGSKPADAFSLTTDHGPRTTDFCPKITDFGLAKLGAGSSLTQTGDMLGTPSYMAPEQVAGKSGDITEAVDVYGLGAILYELLTDRPPFLGATAQATVRQVQDEQPVPPRRVEPSVPRDLETVCLKCLRKEPGHRYATARALADDLRRFRTGEPIRARPVRIVERALIWCRRRPLVAGLLTALAVVFTAGLCGVLWQWHLTQLQKERADRNLHRLRDESRLTQLQKDRADRNLDRLRGEVELITKMGHDLEREPHLNRAALALLQRVLDVYRAIVAEEGNDPRLRHEAAKMFGEVASIYHAVGQWSKALDAFRAQETLLTELVQESPGDEYRRMLARSHRGRGHVLRDQGEPRQARAAYDEAAALQEEFLRAAPDDAGAQVDLANTLHNKSTVMSPWREPEALAKLHERVVDLSRAAVKTDGKNVGHRANLALALEGQGMLFLDSGRLAEARQAIDDSLMVRRELVASRGLTPGHMERYLGRSYTCQGKIHAAAGRATDAEQSYNAAIALLGPLVEKFPLFPFHRQELVRALAGRAEVLTQTGRQHEAVGVRRKVVEHCENLKAKFPEDRPGRRMLVESHLELVQLLWQLDRQHDATQSLARALAVDADDPAVNNELAWFLATTPESRLRDGAKAVHLARKAVGAPAGAKSANYWNTLGAAHYRNGDDRAALTAMATAIDLRAGGIAIDWFFMAMAHARLGEHDEARATFKRAVDWMTRHAPLDGELRRFRAEAQAAIDRMGKRGR